MPTCGWRYFGALDGQPDRRAKVGVHGKMRGHHEVRKKLAGGRPLRTSKEWPSFFVLLLALSIDSSRHLLQWPSFFVLHVLLALSIEVTD